MNGLFASIFGIPLNKTGSWVRVYLARGCKLYLFLAVQKNKDIPQESEKQAANTSLPQKPIKDVIRVNNEKDCTLQGGPWIFNGKGATTSGIKTCHYIHTDQNKPCMDGNECSSGTCFADETSNQGLCAKFAKDSLCTFKKIMSGGKKVDETNCIIE